MGKKNEMEFNLKELNGMEFLRGRGAEPITHNNSFFIVAEEKKRNKRKSSPHPSIFSRSGRKIDWIGCLSLTAQPELLGAPLHSQTKLH